MKGVRYLAVLLGLNALGALACASLGAITRIQDDFLWSAVAGAFLGGPLTFLAAWLMARRVILAPPRLELAMAAVALPFLALLFALGLEPPESIFILAPEIDTVLAPTFTQVGFNQIRAGMTTSEVESLLGRPLYTYGYEDQTHGNILVWAYADDGGCAGRCDFAWHASDVLLHGDVVVETSDGWRFD